MGGEEVGGGRGPSLDSSPLLATPLLERGGSSCSGAVVVAVGGEKDLFCSLCCRSDDAGGILAEVKRQLWLAGPLIAVSLLHYSIQVISVMFVGHLGELPLSGASMATSFANVTGFSVLVCGFLAFFSLAALDDD